MLQCFHSAPFTTHFFVFVLDKDYKEEKNKGLVKSPVMTPAYGMILCH